MEKLRHTEAVDTAQDGLSQQKGATAVILDTKLEMSQRCELMMMPTRHDSLDGKIEMSQH